MKRFHVTLIILISVLLAMLLNIFFGGYLAARLATLPVMRNLNLVNPRAPIVINNKETVRVSDANDAVETVSAIKSKLATLVYYEGSRIVVSGSLLNWTADGYFITASKAFAVPGKTYAVMLSNGEIYPIKQVYADVASNLVLVASDASGLSTVDTIEDKEMRPAQKILFVANSIGNNTITSLESYVRALSTDVPNVELDSDRITRGMSVQSVGPIIPGSPALTLSGRVAGIWDGNAMIASDAIRTFANNFFSENKTVNRAGFGFKYRQVSSSEAAVLKIPSGALVSAVTASGPSAQAGLLAGDVIISVNDKKLSDGTLLETLLEPIRPGEQAVLSVMRSGTSLTLVVTTSALK